MSYRKDNIMRNYFAMDVNSGNRVINSVGIVRARNANEAERIITHILFQKFGIVARFIVGEMDELVIEQLKKFS